MPLLDGLQFALHSLFCLKLSSAGGIISSLVHRLHGFGNRAGSGLSRRSLFRRSFGLGCGLLRCGLGRCRFGRSGFGCRRRRRRGLSGRRRRRRCRLGSLIVFLLAAGGQDNHGTGQCRNEDHSAHFLVSLSLWVYPSRISVPIPLLVKISSNREWGVRPSII